MQYPFYERAGYGRYVHPHAYLRPFPYAHAGMPARDAGSRGDGAHAYGYPFAHAGSRGDGAHAYAYPYAHAGSLSDNALAYAYPYAHAGMPMRNDRSESEFGMSRESSDLSDSSESREEYWDGYFDVPSRTHFSLLNKVKSTVLGKGKTDKVDKKTTTPKTGSSKTNKVDKKTTTQKTGTSNTQRRSRQKGVPKLGSFEAKLLTHIGTQNVEEEENYKKLGKAYKQRRDYCGDRSC